MKRKPKLLLFLLFIVICVGITTILTSCNDDRPDVETIKVIYSATIGGHIDGEVNQTIEKGKDATTVTAVADDGYTFIKWSDEVYEAERTDKNLTADFAVTAIFEKGTYYLLDYRSDIGGKIDGVSEQYVAYGEWGKRVTAVPDDGYIFVEWSDGNTDPTRKDQITKSVTYTATFEQVALKYTYEYNNATDNADVDSVLIYFNRDLSRIYLPVPIRTNSVFEGWFLEKDLNTRVSDENGKIVANYDQLLANESKTLYAGYSLKENVTFKILMVYVSNVSGIFTNYSGNEILIDETVPQQCLDMGLILSDRFEAYLNDIFGGWVNFEVDSYITQQPLNADSFGYLDDINSYYLENIPELNDKDLSEYRLINYILPLENVPLRFSTNPVGHFKYYNIELWRLLLFGRLTGSEESETANMKQYAIPWLIYNFAEAIDAKLGYDDCCLNYLEYIRNLNGEIIMPSYYNMDALREYLTGQTQKPTNKWEKSYEGIPYDFWQKNNL